MSIFDWIAEQKILAAIENGDMEDLPGKGKPIQWPENNHFAEDQQLAYDLLQKNGFTLPWIEEGKDIRHQIEQFRHAVQDAVHTRTMTQSQARERIQSELQKLNQKIMDYNMSVPLERLQIFIINLEQEIMKANLDRPAADQDWQEDGTGTL